MTPRRPVRCLIRRHTGELSGPRGAIHLALQVTGARSHRSPRDREVTCVHIGDLADVICHLQYGQGRSVVYEHAADSEGVPTGGALW